MQNKVADKLVPSSLEKAKQIKFGDPMNYKTDNKDFVQNMYIIKDNLPRKFHDKIIVGISIYNQSPRSAGKKINRLNILFTEVSTKSLLGFY